MTLFFIYFSLLIGFGLPAAYLFSTSFWPISVLSLLFGGCWLVSLKTSWKWGVHLILFTTIALIAVAGFFILPPLIAIISAIFILAAWDLTNFQGLVNRVPESENCAEIEKTHLGKLVVFLVISLVASLGPLIINVRVSFIQSVVLLIMSFIGLMQLTRWLLHRHQQ